MVNGTVVGGVGVGFRAGFLHEGIALVGSEILTAAEHHVFEEMSETAFAGLDLIA